MARTVDLITLNRLAAMKTAVDEVKASGDSDTHRELYKQYRGMVAKRGMQVNHPVHGPALKALDAGATAPAAPSAPEAPEKPKKTTVKTQSKLTMSTRGDEEAPELIRRGIAPSENWVSPGNKEHHDRMTEIATGLDWWANKIQDSGQAGGQGELLAPYHDAINDVYKHLDHHADAHYRPDASTAAQHLNAAAIGIGKAVQTLKKFGGESAEVHPAPSMRQLPTGVSAADKLGILDVVGRGKQGAPRNVDADKLVQKAVSTAADYANTYASGSSAIAKQPKQFSVEFNSPTSGFRFDQPDKSRMTKYEKNLQNPGGGVRGEFTDRSYLPTQPRSQQFSEYIPSPSRTAAKFTTGGKVDKFGQVSARGQAELIPESVDPEKLPLLPSDVKQFADFRTAKQYSKQYGQEVAKRVSDARKAQSKIVELRRADRVPTPAIHDESVSQSSVAKAKSNRLGAIKYKVEKSLVSLDGKVRPEHEALVQNHISTVVRHLNEGNDLDTLPDRVHRELGPKGMDMAVQRFLDSDKQSNVGDEHTEMDYQPEEREATAEEANQQMFKEMMGMNDHFNAGRGAY